MPEHEPYTDSTLGTATWDDARGDWLFTIFLPSGQAVDGSITPEDNRLHLSSPKLKQSRDCVRRIRDNEPALRQFVADKMYQMMLDWHEPEWGAALTKEEFRDRIAVVGVQVLEDHRASLLFTDADCFGGHIITFSVGADGKVDEEPYLWGWPCWPNPLWPSLSKDRCSEGAMNRPVVVVPPGAGWVARAVRLGGSAWRSE